MDIENLPIYPVVDLGSLDDPARPVVSLDWQTDACHRTPGHSHCRAQIIYPLSGVYRVNADGGSFVVPSGQAVWIPPDVFHETYTSAAAHALMLFVDYSLARLLAGQCMVVEVDPFLAQLFIRAVRYGNDYASGCREARLVQVILDELETLSMTPLKVPLARDKRLRRLMDYLLESPADDRGLEELSAECGASGRTLARLFRTEAGMTFVEWRNRLRLQAAIERLGEGQSVTAVAHDLGYQSASAFIAMFRREMGASPGRYLREQVLRSAS